MASLIPLTEFDAKDNIIFECDVLIIGAGIAGTTTAHNLKKLDPNIRVVMIERRFVGSHEPSYYVPKQFLQDYGLEHLIEQEIDRFTYEIDSSEWVSDVDGNGGFANLNYSELCRELLNGTQIKFDSFQDLDTVSRLITLASGDKFLAKVVVDATGWESPIRAAVDLPKPKIGTNTVIWTLENCKVDDENGMILCVGDFASLGFWLEPLGNGRVLVGSGYWCDLDEPMTDEVKTDMDRMLMLYLQKYRTIFKNATIIKKKYAKIGVDPVKTVVRGNLLCIGESAGQTNPYWLLGSGVITEISQEMARIIVDHIKDGRSLYDYQTFWESKRKFYAKMWASARVIWNGDAANWRSIFVKRQELKKYITAEQVVKRQSGGTYGTKYAIKMLGWKRILSVMKYMVIFYRRMRNKQYYQNYKFNYRSPSIGKHQLEMKIEEQVINNQIMEILVTV